jgi:hypothetical protein
MSARKPSHQDADLILKLYELRREPVMRESRKAIVQWAPKSFDDVKAIIEFNHPSNAAWRQVSSYFEMAFGLARHGIVPADFLAENNGEGLLLYAKIEPFLKQFRKEVSPTAFRNAEWVVKKSEWARDRVDFYQKRVQAQRSAEAAAKAK